MRRVELLVPVRRVERVRDVLEDEGVTYTISEPLDAASEHELATVTFPAPVVAVEPILSRLRDAGFDEEECHVMVDRPETIISSSLDEVEQRHRGGREIGTRIPREELDARAWELVPAMRTYFVLLILSVMIAVMGLITNSVAVIVGSMVVAPLMGPALAASVGTVVDDHDLFVRGVVMQLSGVIVAVVVAAAFAAFVQEVRLYPVQDVLSIPAVSSRVAPDLLALGVALAAGTAGAYSLSTGSSTTLVGVAVAAALVPPLGVVGIGIVWGRPLVALGSLVLVLVNILAINLVAVAVFWYQGYRPAWPTVSATRTRMLRRIATIGVCLFVLTAFLGTITLAELEVAATQTEIREDIHAVLDQPEYADHDLIEIRFTNNDALPVPQPDRVIVKVGYPPGEKNENLVFDLREAIDDDLTIDVHFDTQL